MDYYRIKPLVEALLTHDKHGTEDSYPVYSIYLDDVYHSGAMDKAFGNQYHKKYRIRHYHDKSKKKLELKEKTGIEAKKTSTNISEEVYQAILDNNLDVLEQHFDDPLIRRYSLDNLRYHFTPQCNIVYKREAFSDSLDNIRITFDHSLKSNLFSTQNQSEFINIIDGAHLILEIKYEHFIPKEIKQAIKSRTIQEIAYSKYFLGYAQLRP